MNFLTPVFRVSFPNLFKARAFSENQKAKYGVTMLFDTADIQGDPKQTELWAAMKAAVKTCALEKWNSADKIPSNFRNPFRKGEEKEYDGYHEGIIYAVAKRSEDQGKPGIVDQDVNPVLDVSEFYAGCYAQATISVFAYSHMGNNGVSFGLNNIQKVRDGDPFSGRSNAGDDFSALDGPTVVLDETVNSSVETDLFG